MPQHLPPKQEFLWQRLAPIRLHRIAFWRPARLWNAKKRRPSHDDEDEQRDSYSPLLLPEADVHDVNEEEDEIVLLSAAPQQQQQQQQVVELVANQQNYLYQYHYHYNEEEENNQDDEDEDDDAVVALQARMEPRRRLFLHHLEYYGNNNNHAGEEKHNASHEIMRQGRLSPPSPLQLFLPSLEAEPVSDNESIEQEDESVLLPPRAEEELAILTKEEDNQNEYQHYEEPEEYYWMFFSLYSQHVCCICFTFFETKVPWLIHNTHTDCNTISYNTNGACLLVTRRIYYFITIKFFN